VFYVLKQLNLNIINVGIEVFPHSWWM